ncbi:MAG: type I polyketide synthase, partial [Caldilineaceae bacterium]|nr:type I polyketide synthase [Caldilineaceae bacterium]
MENLSPIKRALLELREMKAKLDTLEQAAFEPIAITGIGLRFPGGASDLRSFWQLLAEGQDAIIETPPERWDVEAYYDPDPAAPGKMYARGGGFLLGIDQFDPYFFGISPREAHTMDPQQRLLLEVSWEALENAGYAPDRLKGSQTGVYVGLTGIGDYGRLLISDLAQIEAYMATGNGDSVAAGRLAYTLGLHGPAVVVDTACSSSLLSVHLACQSLRNQEIDLALAGGVNVVLSPEGSVALSKMQALSPDSRCKTFDAAADGYVRGEGCGMIVLKRLSDARAAGDTILALIRGSAVNQDGRSSGLTAPNGPAQAAVIRQALANAHVSPAKVHYVETHGTGTPLGDPIEVQALMAVYGKERPADRPLVIGSVKTNIGHLEGAAGIAGLIKTVLALRHGTIPPHLHFHTPNPHIAWESSPVVVGTAAMPWPQDAPKFAGLSSFGFSGTNAHMILEAAPATDLRIAQMERPLHLLALSAKDETALQQLSNRYRQTLAESNVTLADICYTANTGRTHMNRRLALVAGSAAELVEKLATSAAGRSAPGVARGEVSDAQDKDVVFLFTGQGSQAVGMGRELYETQPVFRDALDECDRRLRPYLDHSLIALLYSGDPNLGALLDETQYTQPALFAVEYALAQLWIAWGVRPAAVLGHSVGEVVAACVAGVFSLGDALALIAQRARLMQALPKDGMMAAVFAHEARLTAALAAYSDQVSIAAVNGPQHIVISGSQAAVEAVLAELAQEGIRTQRLNVSHAFHSPLMAPMLDPFERAARAVDFHTPQIPLISNLTGEMLGVG